VVVARRPADQPGRIRVSFTVGGTRVAEADAVEFTPRELRQLGNDRPLLGELAVLGELAALGQGELLGADQPLPPRPAGAPDRAPWAGSASGWLWCCCSPASRSRGGAPARPGGAPPRQEGERRSADELAPRGVVGVQELVALVPAGPIGEELLAG